VPVAAIKRDAATADFFAGTERGELMLRRCDSCGALSRPQARSCGRCQSAGLSWFPAQGLGTVVSWAVVHARPASPDPASPDPASPDPASPDPASPDPASTDPASTHPNSTDPASPDPASTEPPPPVVVAIVELAEGPWLHAQLTGVDPAAVRGGQPVTVAFERPEGGEAIPVFRPA
jgi:uncharacterized OB-fold protein